MMDAVSPPPVPELPKPKRPPLPKKPERFSIPEVREVKTASEVLSQGGWTMQLVFDEALGSFTPDELSRRNDITLQQLAGFRENDIYLAEVANTRKQMASANPVINRATALLGAALPSLYKDGTDGAATIAERVKAIGLLKTIAGFDKAPTQQVSVQLGAVRVSTGIDGLDFNNRDAAVTVVPDKSKGIISGDD